MAKDEEQDLKIKEVEEKQKKLEEEIQVYGKARAGIEYKARMRGELDRKWSESQARKNKVRTIY